VSTDDEEDGAGVHFFAGALDFAALFTRVSSVTMKFAAWSRRRYT
jgi:hypothetical protein